jgi:hypothetical protein
MADAQTRIEDMLAGRVHLGALEDEAVALRQVVSESLKRTDEGYAGYCHLIAYHLAAVTNGTLVHALLHCPNPPPAALFHAWVEIDGIGADLTQKPGSPSRFWADCPWHVLESRRYSAGDALGQCLRHAHYGPWDPVFEDERFTVDPRTKLT